ncbi:hypothetical protein B484DRAFT_471254, partial [Ochromonadaceae sp. CCMP2298]
MSKIYPAGKTKEIKLFQGFLSKTRCDWFLDNYPGSLLTFVAEVNEGTRVYSSELNNAKEKGFIDAVQREAVATQMNRVNSGNGDSERQPASVRSRLKTQIMFEGKPKDIDEFILRLLTEADYIAAANAEMTACGVNYRPIDKVGDRSTGQQGQHPDNTGKDRAKAAAAAAKAAGGAAFVCNGCGGPRHKYKDFPRSEHPDFNSGKLFWALSDSGKCYASAGKTHIRNDKGDKPKWQAKKGAVLDNYCSETVGDWVQKYHSDCWDADIDTEPVDLACIGSSAVPLGRCMLNLILMKDDW